MTTKAKVAFKPLGNRVVVQASDEDDQVSSAGTVVAVGPGKLADDGKRIPMEVAVGDTVIYSKYAGTEYKEGDEEYLVLREDDILFKK